MRKFILTCILFVSITGFRTGEEIKVSGNILAEERYTTAFNSVEASSGVNVTIVQGDFSPIRVEADEHLLPNIKTIVRNNTLKIYIPNSITIKNDEDIRITVTLPSIYRIAARSYASVNCSDQCWEEDSILLETKYRGRIKMFTKTQQAKIISSVYSVTELKGEACMINIEAKVGSFIHAQDLGIENVKLYLATNAQAKLSATKGADCHISGYARLFYNGDLSILKSKLYSGGYIVENNK